MKRPYEISLLFRILSNDEELQAALDQVLGWIEAPTEDDTLGKVTRIDRNLLGRRKLAYEIDGQRDGYYIIVEADIEPGHITELELNLKLFNPLLRFLVVRAEGKPVTAPSDAPAKSSDDDDDDSDDSNDSEE